MTTTDASADGPTGERPLSDRQRSILAVIEQHLDERGYPPSVREIGEAVGLTSPSTVHTHLATLQRLGYLRRDPTKPRALEVRYDAASGATAERASTRHVPLVGEVAAGTDVLANEQVEELVPVPSDLCGEGELFMLRVRGTSMIEAGILDGDLVVVRRQPDALDGEIVVAALPGEEATVKTLRHRGPVIVLEPANPDFVPIEVAADEAQIYGRVVTVLRKV
ncbi:MAG: transcriptional repressor LexA [Actinomycetota bacterium]